MFVGTNITEVNDATSASHPNVEYSSLGDVNSYDPILAAGTLYYWRVDALNSDPNVWKGPVWSFTTVSALAPPVYEQLNAGRFGGSRVDTLPDNLAIGSEGTICFEIKNPDFDNGNVWFAMKSGGWLSSSGP